MIGGARGLALGDQNDLIPDRVIAETCRDLASRAKRALTGPQGGRLVVPISLLRKIGVSENVAQAFLSAYDMATWMERAADALARHRAIRLRVLQRDGHVHHVLRRLADGDISTDKALELICELLESGQISDATPVPKEMAFLREASPSGQKEN